MRQLTVSIYLDQGSKTRKFITLRGPINEIAYQIREISPQLALQDIMGTIYSALGVDDEILWLSSPSGRTGLTLDTIADFDLPKPHMGSCWGYCTELEDVVQALKQSSIAEASDA